MKEWTKLRSNEGRNEWRNEQRSKEGRIDWRFELRKQWSNEGYEQWRDETKESKKERKTGTVCNYVAAWNNEDNNEGIYLGTNDEESYEAMKQWTSERLTDRYGLQLRCCFKQWKESSVEQITVKSSV